MSASSEKRQLMVRAIRWQAQGICSFEFEEPSLLYTSDAADDYMPV
jgi:hypothetical protein